MCCMEVQYSTVQYSTVQGEPQTQSCLTSALVKTSSRYLMFIGPCIIVIVEK